MKTTMGSTYTTNAARPATFMQQVVQQHLARLQYGEPRQYGGRMSFATLQGVVFKKI